MKLVGDPRRSPAIPGERLADALAAPSPLCQYERDIDRPGVYCTKVIEEVQMLSSPCQSPLMVHDVGVSAHRGRRRFTAAYEQQMVEEAAG